MKKIFREFKDFAMRGNMIDMAVGIIIGGGFGKLVSSLVNDILMPPIGVLLGNVNYTDLKITLKRAYMNADGVDMPAVTINYGNFTQTLIDFIIVAFCIFMVVKGINKLRSLSKEKTESAVEPTKEEQLLTEIRDILKNKTTQL